MEEYYGWSMGEKRGPLGAPEGLPSPLIPFDSSMEIIPGGNYPPMTKILWFAKGRKSRTIASVRIFM